LSILGRLWRKLWHLIAGSFFPVLALFIPFPALLISLGAVTAMFVIWEIIRLTYPSLNQRMMARFGVMLKSGERYLPTGSTFFLIATFAVFAVFEKHVADTSVLFLAVGDTAATLVGGKFGIIKVFGKSLEGSFACLVACLFIGFVMSEVSPSLLLPAAIAGAVAATIVELLPVPLDDNLTIPILSAGIITLSTIYIGMP